MVKVTVTTDMDFFRRILSVSLDTFEENAASYEISANPGNVPDPASLDSDESIRQINENPDVRQVLHIAFGVILKRMGDELRVMLRNNSDIYRDYLVKHIGRHIKQLKGM
ncbi:MAG: hypothetical protein JXB48_03980 [Candidatus Latescibacteria bacterium]|nr:hypothetical protein [Candidatus Latescibacterota bacterium]